MDSDDPLEGRFGLFTNSMVVAADGSIYLTDAPCDAFTDAHAIRKIDPKGAVTTVAKGDPAPTSAAELTSFVIPNGIAIDKEGNLFVSDARDAKGMMDTGVCANGEWPAGLPFPPPGQQPGIWRVSTAGEISIFAGVNSQAGDGADFVDGVGESASFKYPGPIAFSDDGLLHLIDNGSGLHSYRTIDAGALVSTKQASYAPNLVAAPNKKIYATTGCIDSTGPAPDLVDLGTGEVIAQNIPDPTLVAVDGAGNVYSTSPESRQTFSTIYRKASGDSHFSPVATGVYKVRAMTTGPDGSLYLKSAHAVIRISFK
ncbi:MAG: hypothetical protein QM772_11535 [Ottowia sp.]|uniref:hypothetical protein n=1 Tax=Ottowia sp. TaxID=1898956 RepID=UPI0039E39926